MEGKPSFRGLTAPAEIEAHAGDATRGEPIRKDVESVVSVPRVSVTEHDEGMSLPESAAGTRNGDGGLQAGTLTVEDLIELHFARILG